MLILQFKIVMIWIAIETEMAFFVYLLFSTNLTGFSCFENDVGPSHDVYMNYCLYTITKPLTSGQKIRPIFSYFVNSLGFQYV